MPRAAGVGSAVGLVGADLRVDLVQTCVVDVDGGDPAVLEHAFASLAARGRAELGDEAGATFEVSRAADIRYRGQAHHLTLPVPEAVDLAELRDAFRRAFSAAYGIAPALAAQVHNVRVQVTRVVEKYTAPERAVSVVDETRACTGERAVVFPGEGGGALVSALFDRSRLTPGTQVDGPAVIAASDCTISVPPRTRARVDAFGTIVLTPTPTD